MGRGCLPAPPPTGSSSKAPERGVLAGPVRAGCDDAIERGFTGHIAALIQLIRDDVGWGSAAVFGMVAPSVSRCSSHANCLTH